MGVFVGPDIIPYPETPLSLSSQLLGDILQLSSLINPLTRRKLDCQMGGSP
jgi:hypothetical protein